MTKVDLGALPQAPNVECLGLTPCERLPEVVAGVDGALTPFALHGAASSTSPAITSEQAPQYGLGAAVAGLSDAGPGASQLAGPPVPLLGEAVVSSATSCLRAPPLARIRAGLRLHPAGDADGCPTCSVAPCPSAQGLRS